MNHPPLTLVGNLVDDPDLKFTPSGAAVANFRIACTPRNFDRSTNAWADGETLFMTCSVWRELAENVAESLTKGMRVVVTGKLRARTYTTAGGEKRTVSELDVDEVGPSLRYATAQVQRRGRGEGPRPTERATRTATNTSPWDAPAADSWGSGAGGQSDDPPF